MAGWVLLGAIIASALALFYFGYYRYLLVTDSSSFSLENSRYVIQNHRDATTLVLGDSTAAHDFRTNYYNRYAGAEKAVNVGVPGTGLFTYHKFALFAKQQAPGLRNVILIAGPDLFSDKGEGRIFSDLEYNKTALTLQDVSLIWNYTDSFKSFMRGAADLVFRPVLFGKDMRNLLLHPAQRLESAKESYRWLRRPLLSNDPQWEDDRGFTVCGIGDLDQLRSSIEQADSSRAEILKWIQQGYEPRKNSRDINPPVARQLLVLVTDLASMYEKIYVVNAPIYSGFQKVYSRDYLQKIYTVTAGISGLFPNVNYVQPSAAFNDDCSNFLDVVHLNKFGAERFTGYLLAEIGKREMKPLILTGYGPEEIHAGRVFNAQPSGESAIWTLTENGTASTVLVLNGTILETVVYPDGKLATAIVPRELYKKPGAYSLYLLDKKTKAKSNILKLIVK